MTLQDLDILAVADRLGISYSQRGEWRKALCFIHSDHHPSLGLSASRNRWRCFACGEGGNVIDLVMRHENLDFAGACRWLSHEFQINLPHHHERQPSTHTINDKIMNINEFTNENNHYLSQALLTPFEGAHSDFTSALVQTGFLTMEQMRHAAQTYRLGSASCADHYGNSSPVVFWQINAEGHICEGKVMYYQADAHRSQVRNPVSISWLLRQKHLLPEGWKAQNCLFGLHLLHEVHDNENDTLRYDTLHYDNDNQIIAIVESEKTAIICSERLPTINQGSGQIPVIWMATGGLNNLSVQILLPLKGQKIILFPDTDPTGKAYADWLRIAGEAAKVLGHPVNVSNLLEHYATEEQKQRKIDIADFIIEN